uniref:HTH luxR-type domain-containing protein n=1 Tax=uncultured Armatimonadetes bacterium TaxID=157466 RepID=A0A6J4HPM9_9BACT|nr:hypothetical protein AVDCRST_MAG63-971 [uncultured Armatimonadetes bacterium]
MGAKEDRSQNLLGILSDAARRIAATKAEDPYHLYETLHGTAARLAPVDAFYVCLYSPADNTLFFSYNYDDGVYDHPSTLPMGNGPTAWVVRNRKPFLLRPETEPTQQGGLSFGDTSRVSRSALHVPMRAWGDDGEERLLGVVSAQSYEPDVYDADTVHALQWLADQAGIALQRHRDIALWRGRAEAAQTRRSEHRRQAIAMTDAFVRILKTITKDAEALRPLLPPDGDALRAAVERLCHDCYRSQTEANQLPLHLGQPSTTPPPSSPPPGLPDKLTKTEREILRLLTHGLSNKDIAGRLTTSENTVKFHCKNLFRKLGARNRVEAVRHASSLLPDLDKTYPKG